MNKVLIFTLVVLVFALFAQSGFARKKMDFSSEREAAVLNSFNQLDTDGDGYIEERELSGYDRSVEDYYMDMDLDGDEEISLEEYRQHIGGSSNGSMDYVPNTPNLPNRRR